MEVSTDLTLTLTLTLIEIGGIYGHGHQGGYPCFGTGSVIGVSYNQTKKLVTFFRDGEQIMECEYQDAAESLLPAVSTRRGAVVQFNFGDTPFQRRLTHDSDSDSDSDNDSMRLPEAHTRGFRNCSGNNIERENCVFGEGQGSSFGFAAFDALWGCLEVRRAYGNPKPEYDMQGQWSQEHTLDSPPLQSTPNGGTPPVEKTPSCVNSPSQGPVVHTLGSPTLSHRAAFALA